MCRERCSGKQSRVTCTQRLVACVACVLHLALLTGRLKTWHGTAKAPSVTSVPTFYTFVLVAKHFAHGASRNRTKLPRRRMQICARA